MGRRLISWCLILTTWMIVSSLDAEECSADWFGFFHPHTVYYSKTKTFGGSPITGVMMTGTPMTGNLMVASSSTATAPSTNLAPKPQLPGAPVAPASPVVGALGRPLSPFQHLFGFSPETGGKISPAGASAEQVNASHNLGQKIMTGLESFGTALLSDQGGQVSPLQAAVNIFANETGAAPVAEDVAVLAKLASQTVQKVRGTATPLAPVPVAGSDSGTSTIQITITVQGPAKIGVTAPTGTTVTNPSPTATPPPPAPAPPATVTPGVPGHTVPATPPPPGNP